MIIDCHMHAHYDEALAAYGEPYLRCADIYKSVRVSHFHGDPRRPIELADTAQHLTESGIDLGIIVNLGGSPLSPRALANERLARAIEPFKDRLRAFAAVDPREGPEAVAELRDALANLGMIGLKVHPSYQAIYPNDKQLMYPLYEVCAEFKVPVLLHTGSTLLAGTKVKYSQPTHVDEAAVDFPEIYFIMAHFGWPWVDEAIAVAWRNPNVYIDVSGHLPKHVPQYIWHYAQVGDLSNRFVFGSDYPFIKSGDLLKMYQDFDRWHCTLCNREETWKPGVKEKLLGNNFYQLIKHLM